MVMETMRMENPIEINSSPERFYDVFMTRSNLIPVFSPRTTLSLQLVEDETTPTSVVYTTQRFVNGDLITMTERIEEDKENRSLVATLVKGDALEMYNYLRGIFQVIPKEDGEGSNAHLSIEYEKKNEDAWSPDIFGVMMIYLTQDIDAGLTKEEEQDQSN